MGLKISFWNSGHYLRALLIWKFTSPVDVERKLGDLGLFL